jgi:hypothetical protein
VRRRGDVADGVPERLLVYRPADWPSTAAWHEARRRWVGEHRPATLIELNALYAPGVVFPLAADPREAA